MKMRSKKGFTLMEMLIVVAIIAILVAIAIPTFSSALTKAKVAADKANVRAAYAECMMECMLDEKTVFPNGQAFADRIGTLQSGNKITYAIDDTKKIVTISFSDLTLTVDKALFADTVAAGEFAYTPKT